MNTTLAADPGTTSAAEVSPERRRFLRQGQLAGTAIGGMAGSIVSGLLPPRLDVVEIGPDLTTFPLEGLLIAVAPILVGSILGFLVWVTFYERRRPNILGKPWSGERDWAITGGMFVAYVLTRAVIPAGAAATGLYSTGDPNVLIRVEAPVDIAIALVRFLASASIAAILFRVITDARNVSRRSANRLG